MIQKNNYKILIVGLGNIGFRYLEGILKSEIKCSVTLLETSFTNLNIIKSKLENNKYKKSINYMNNIDDLEGMFDVGIIATPALLRNLLIQKLNSKVLIENWIIEKVLAQSSCECNQINKILSQKKAWVNLPRRAMVFYKVLRRFFNNIVIKEINIIGGNWGLACNSVHYLDLIEYLSNQNIKSIDTSKLEKNWFPSKRQGFFEINGVVSGKTNNGIPFKLECKDNSMDRLIIIKSKDVEFTINESKEEVFFNDKKKNRVILSYQSDIIEPILKDILYYSKCDLPSLKDNVKVHNLFLEELQKSWNNFKCSIDSKVPIT